MRPAEGAAEGGRQKKNFIKMLAAIYIQIYICIYTYIHDGYVYIHTYMYTRNLLKNSADQVSSSSCICICLYTKNVYSKMFAAQTCSIVRGQLFSKKNTHKFPRTNPSLFPEKRVIQIELLIDET